MSQNVASQSHVQSPTDEVTAPMVVDATVPKAKREPKLSKQSKDFLREWVRTENNNYAPRVQQMPALLQQLQVIQGRPADEKSIKVFCANVRSKYNKQKRDEEVLETQTRRENRRQSFRFMFETFTLKNFHHASVFMRGDPDPSDALINIWAEHLKQTPEDVKRFVVSYTVALKDEPDLHRTFDPNDNDLSDEDQLPFESTPPPPPPNRVRSPPLSLKSQTRYTAQRIPTPSSDSTSPLINLDMNLARRVLDTTASEATYFPPTPSSASSAPLPQVSVPPPSPQPSWATINMQHPQPVYPPGSQADIQVKSESTTPFPPAVVPSQPRPLRIDTQVDRVIGASTSASAPDSSVQVSAMLTGNSLGLYDNLQGTSRTQQSQAVPRPFSYLEAPIDRPMLFENTQHPTNNHVQQLEAMASPAAVSIYEHREILNLNSQLPVHQIDNAAAIPTRPRNSSISSVASGSSSVPLASIYRPKSATGFTQGFLGRPGVHLETPSRRASDSAIYAHHTLPTPTQLYQKQHQPQQSALTTPIKNEPLPSPTMQHLPLFIEALQTARERASVPQTLHQNPTEYLDGLSGFAQYWNQARQKGAFAGLGFSPPKER